MNTEISITIKFNGVTLENVTLEQARELRDKLNAALGEKREYDPWSFGRTRDPWQPPIYEDCTDTPRTTCDNKITLYAGDSFSIDASGIVASRA